MSNDIPTTTCWGSCLMCIKYIQAMCKQAQSHKHPREEIYKTEQDYVYILTQYEYDNQTYNIPVKIEKGKTMRLIRASRIDESDQEVEDITSIVKAWLGPNEDFHHAVVTPRLLNYTKIRLYSLDEETFDTIHKSFDQDEVLYLPNEEVELESISGCQIVIDENSIPRGEDSPTLDNDPREPRPSRPSLISIETENGPVHFSTSELMEKHMM